MTRKVSAILRVFNTYIFSHKGLVKKYGGGGGWLPEQRGAGSSVFEPLVRGGSLNFQLPLRGGSSCFFFFYGDWHTFDNKGNSFQTIDPSPKWRPKI